jgi:succinylglutamate desuccinylase
MQLDQIDHLPRSLAHLRPERVRSVFPNPTLIRLTGDRPEPLVLSTLLHGNETTSLEVLKHLQRRYESAPLPRSLMIFVGNVRATEQGLRHLPGEMDFNRIWAGGDSPAHALAQQVQEAAMGVSPFASIDIHNNTGTNPIYGCVNTLRPADLDLAARFAPLGVFYLNPATTQSVAFSKICPAITLECGRSGDVEGLMAAIELVETIMRLDHFADHPPDPRSLRLFETVGRVEIVPDCTFRFDPKPADLNFDAGLEDLNFQPLPAGACLALTSRPHLPLRVVDEHGADLTSDFLELQTGQIRLTQGLTPAMITTDVTNIRQDCLCYFMRQRPLPERSGSV